MTLDAALALFSLCLVAATYVWQTGRTERQRLAIGWERERYSATQFAEAKRWEDAVSAKAEELKAFKEAHDALAIRVKRMEENRVVLGRTG